MRACPQCGVAYGDEMERCPEDGTRLSISPAQTRKLAAIMFTDMVGFSELVHRDEAEGRRLLELQRAAVRALLPRYGGHEVEVIGDAFLVTFESARSALECAVAIQKSVAGMEGPVRPTLRIGLHLGDVESAGKGIYGDSVNIAARVQALAAAGGLAVSGEMYSQVRNKAGFEFVRMGPQRLKGIAEPVDVFRLDPVEIAAPPARLPSQDGLLRRASRSRRVVLGAVAIILLAAAGIVVGLRRRAAVPDAHSVAVLPLDNLSPEADSGYFADGLHDTLLTHLAQVRGIRVISRTSVLRYRSPQRDLRKIAAELNVAHIVEGTVQRSGDRLRVHAQLIHAATDTHLWAEGYDRRLGDVFGVQAELAERIVDGVEGRLSPDEKARIERPPTRNLDAYDQYLRGLELLHRPFRTLPDDRAAVAALERAVALDSAFAQAHARLAEAHDRLYWFGGDSSDARRQKVGEAAASALRLRPDLADGHIAKARYLYHGYLDYPAALSELEQARRLAPGNPALHSMLAIVYRRQGRQPESLGSFAVARELGPRDESFLGEYSWSLRALRRYEEADRLAAEWQAFSAEPSGAAWARAENLLLWKGRLEPLEEALARLPPDADALGAVSLRKGMLLLVRRRFAEAAATVLALPEESFSHASPFVRSRNFWAGLVYWAAGDLKRARIYLRKERPRFEARLRATPDEARDRFGLAVCLGVVGERGRAAAELARALDAAPMTKDAVIGATLRRAAAHAYALMGDHDRALALLEESLEQPFGAHAHEEEINPMWDGLRKDPRFVRLLAKHRPR